MEIEDENHSSSASKIIIEIMDYEKKSEAIKQKITTDELDNSLTRMKELNSRVDFDT
jgi:hypothetical protein